jgi:SAM-dependent methyltransferase
MYDKKLELFKRNGTTIWTDDYISKSLLKSHIDDSPNGASRKGEQFNDTIKWINSKIDKNSSIIDFGCGPGLYSYELGKWGHNVFGIDFNKESIHYAQENKIISGKIEYKYGNFLKDTIDGKFDAAILICNEFGALVPDEQRIILKKIHELLKESGVFLVDCFDKKAIEVEYKEGKNWYVSNGDDFWSKEPYFLMEETKYFLEERAVGRRYYIISQITRKIKEFYLWDQFYDKNTIEDLLVENGFEVIEIEKEIVRGEGLFVTAKKNKL